MCGIGGIIYTEPKKLNITEFNIIGSLNDERGGDSCGVYMDGYVNYGIGTKAKFRNFIPDIEYPDKSMINFVHCRKTSIGYTTNLDQAQPVIIKNDNDEIDFVLMHNGTIKNIDELAKKYIPDFDTKDKSDSQIIAQIMYEKGYDVLEEYTGCAVFAIIDYRPDHDHILFWKGSSCYNPVNEKSERPLYVMSYNSNFYFSSMSEPFICINPKYQPLVLSANKLIYLGEDMELHVRKVYDRSKLVAPTVTSYTYPSYNDWYSHNYSFQPKYLKYEPISATYFLGNEIADGEVSTYSTGYVYKNGSTSYGDSIWFWKGKIVYNEDCYNVLDLFAGTMDEKQFQALVDYFSYAPVIIDGEVKRVNKNLEYYTPENDEWFTLFSNPTCYEFDGTNIFHKQVQSYKCFSEFLNQLKAKKFSEQDLIDWISDLIY